jgi:hypothetical protein
VPGKKKPSPKTEKSSSKRPIEQYDHKSKTRINNPPVGLVTPRTDPPVTSRKTYPYDPHSPKENDARLIGQFLQCVPDYLRQEFGFGFARGLDLLRRQSNLKWTN